jgi:hypothetical protein
LLCTYVSFNDFEDILTIFKEESQIGMYVYTSFKTSSSVVRSFSPIHVFISQFNLSANACSCFIQASGLPDGIFSYQKSQFGYILENLGMENVGIFIPICNILPPFGIVLVNLVYFWSFG